jgi:hypothetical protein
MPSVRAVCRLMTNSNRVGCMTGISAGFSPLEYAADVNAGLSLHLLDIGASRINEIDTAFADLVLKGADALIVGSSSMLSGRGSQLATLAAYYRLPTIYYVRQTAVAHQPAVEDLDMPSDRSSRRTQSRYNGLGIRSIGLHEQGIVLCCRN